MNEGSHFIRLIISINELKFINSPETVETLHFLNENAINTKIFFSLSLTQAEKVKAYLINGARKLPGFSEWPNPEMGWGALCVKDSIPM